MIFYPDSFNLSVRIPQSYEIDPFLTRMDMMYGYDLWRFTRRRWYKKRAEAADRRRGRPRWHWTEWMGQFPY